MSELLSEIDWSIILILIAISAVVAWFGDVIGMKLGKKRITIGKLRPKYTTRVISVLTGIGIAFATLFVSAMASESVRTAIFSMKYMRSQVATLTSEVKSNKEDLSAMEYQLLQSRENLFQKQSKLSVVEKELASGSKKLSTAEKKLAELEAARDKAAEEKKKLSNELSVLKDEISSLSVEAASLKNNVQHLREGRIAAFSGEILAQGVVSSSKKMTNEQIDNAIDRLSAECKAMLAERFGVDVHAIPNPNINKESIERVRSKLKNSSGRFLIRVSALSNAVAGEPVSTEISVYPTKLIYKNGELLEKIKFKGRQSRAEIESKLSDSLKNVNKKAVKDGVLRDPISGTVGSIDSSELSGVIKNIVASTDPCVLELRTAREIYTEGPVKLKLNIKPQQ